MVGGTLPPHSAGGWTQRSNTPSQPDKPDMTSLPLYLCLFFHLGMLSLCQKDAVSQEDAELHCPPCKKVHCFPRRVKSLKCKGGRTLGVCNCCPVCAKVEGESCGGQWNYLGKCDANLHCQPQENVVYSYRVDGAQKIYSLTKGVCKKGSPELSSDQAYADFCRPKCTPEYCRKGPKAICSASNNAEKMQHCQAPCQHTSCRSCHFLQPEDICVKCSHDDFRCIQKHGKCVRKQYCQKTFPCKADMVIEQTDGKFQCQVPECLTKKPDAVYGKG